MQELGIVRYDSMCRAIAACLKVDEVKELRDKARALEVYAAQALNTVAERKAREIRIRAERRAGQLLKGMKETGERDKGAGGNRRSRSDDATVKTTLKDIGISKDQSSNWQELAEIPEQEFEEALASPDVIPSTEGILMARRPVIEVPQVPQDAMWFWGAIKDFEREGAFDKDPNVLIGRMLDTMQADMERLLPMLFSWLSQIGVDDGKFSS
jgi:hypothetical protein